MLSTLRLSPSPFGAVPILLLPSRSSSRLGSISESRQSRRATSTAPCLSHLLRHRATSAAPLRDCDSFNPRSRVLDFWLIDCHC
ncbi:hypothetical protein RchiOBHm_Chr3g0462111 [Rosa chinensis]|uniref:Uncharacterized protein n=1 Tax=Rosa chinensis TaxID=74649 RepID=A0A2P6R8T9_ROSCH|nr:hypothetical protein RchiOBHm_Chr3g0462111 [Rosa chinensis]